MFKVSEQIYILFTHVLSALPFLALAIRPSSGSPCYHSPSHAPLINFPWIHHCKFPGRHYCFSLTSRVDLVSAGIVILPASLAGCFWEASGRRSSSSLFCYYADLSCLFCIVVHPPFLFIRTSENRRFSFFSPPWGKIPLCEKSISLTLGWIFSHPRPILLPVPQSLPQLFLPPFILLYLPPSLPPALIPPSALKMAGKMDNYSVRASVLGARPKEATDTSGRVKPRHTIAPLPCLIFWRVWRGEQGDLDLGVFFVLLLDTNNFL